MIKRKISMILAILFITATAAVASTSLLPQTGQTTCYDSIGNTISCTGTGQDGEVQVGVAWPSPRFQDNGDQTQTDKLTGLIWAKDGSTPTSDSCAGGIKTWQAALDYVACLNSNNYLGYNDWRLPNINELESIIDLSKSYPALPLGHPFSNVQSYNLYWSSSTYAYDTGYAWYVSMGNGRVYCAGKDYYGYVWPVRSGQCGSLDNSAICLSKTGQTTKISDGDDGDLQKGVAWPSPRFIYNGDGTVSDNLTGLDWAKDAGGPTFGSCMGGSKTWQGALDYVACLNTNNYLGHNDWRLSDRKELLSLIDRSQYGPSVLSSHPFLNVRAYYWSSSTYADSTGYAWYVYMGDGYVNYGSKDNDYYVWPVRSGQSGALGHSVISVFPPTKNFGNVNVNGTSSFSSAQIFTISNTGAADLVISSIDTTGGDSAMFNVSMVTCPSLSSTIAAGASCTVSVTFTPASVGTKAATLRIASNDPSNAILDISLSGTGVNSTSMLTVNKTGTGTGTVTAGVNCALSWTSNTGACTVSSGTSIALSGAADAGSTFTGWSGGGCSGTGQCVLTMTAAANVTAVFTASEPPVSGTITDSLTGLEWTKDAGTPTFAFCTGGTMTLKDALAYVACLNTNNYLNHNDWRLPNSDELKEALCAQELLGFITDLQPGFYWSSTSFADDTSYAWVSGLCGFVDVSDKTYYNYVWLVRGGQSGSEGNSVTISPSNKSFNKKAASGSIRITGSDKNCAWTATANDDWITIKSGASGSGKKGAVVYAVVANSGSASRTGTITINDETFTIKQAGAPCKYAIPPSSSKPAISSSGGTGSLTVTPTPSDCSWTADVDSKSKAWVTITDGNSGTGTGTVSYSVSAKTTKKARTGKINIIGSDGKVKKTFTVRQAK